VARPGVCNAGPRVFSFREKGFTEMSIANLTAESKLAVALSYARRGWHVLPLHTVIDGLCTCGDTECRSANIGIRTGPESGLWVLGPDGDVGLRDLDELQQQFGPLPETLTVETGGGGQHLYFQWPADGVVVRNVANHGSTPGPRRPTIHR
jgi:hypothetical protein